RKFADFEAMGWYPGDTHMHFPDPSGVRYEMECEGLRVCSLLLLKSGYKTGRPGDGHFWNAEHFTGKLDPVSGTGHFVKVGEEFRHGLLAHLIFQNLKSIVWPVSTGGLRESGVGGFDWPLMLHASDDAHQQGALVTWAHWPYPSMEAPLDIALGRIDSLDILTTGNPFEHHPILVDIYKMHGPSAYTTPPIEMYYHYLNTGFRLAASSGSDKMATNPPMGSARTYVKTDGPLSYDSWIEGIRKGRTFISTYPLLEFTVNGKEAGETLALPPGKAKLEVKARARSLEPYQVLEILVNGQVLARATPSGGHHEARIDTTLEVQRGGWIAARAHGPKMLEYGATWWKMPVFAHTSPIYLQMPGRPAPSAASAKILLEQLGYLRRWAESRANFPAPESKAEALSLIAQAEAIYEKLRDIQ
ncbi:MAG: CehA/McbA family metallohydrolase, partial [Acidobacteria bacterium]|nr:CehA/McbA family metallohydrolase [Acidobacteriota bacterium]